MKDTAALIALNVLVVLAGRGALRTLRVRVGRGSWIEQAGLWCFTGAAVLGLVRAESAVIAGPGGFALAIGTAAILVALGEWRSNDGHPALSAVWRLTRVTLVEGALLAVNLALAVATVAAATVSPLEAWDGWAIWGARAHALFVSGDAWSPLFTSEMYVRQHLEYPLWLPALETLSLEAIGRFDAGLVDVQPALLYASFPFALWGLLRGVVPGWLAALAPLPIVSSPALRQNLSSNYADAVLALVLAMALVCVAIWLERGDVGLLRLGAVFLAAASLAKSEGLVLALGLVIVTILVAPAFGRRRAAPAVAGAVALAVTMPWWLFVRGHGIESEAFSVASIVDPAFLARRAERVSPAAGELIDELAYTWRLPTAIGVLGLIASIAVGRYALAALVTAWCAWSLAALTMSYWISRLPIEQHLATSAGRVVCSVAVGMAAVAPILCYGAWRALVPPMSRIGVRGSAP